MDLGLTQKRALIVGDRIWAARACAAALLAEGAEVACEFTFAGALDPRVSALPKRLNSDPAGLAEAAFSLMGGVDIVVAALDLARAESLPFDEDETGLTSAWESLTALSALYQVAAARMREQGFGRFVWTGPIDAKQLGDDGGDIDTVVGMGALALHKVISGEMGPYGVTANAVLWDSAAASEADLAEGLGSSVAWLASEPAAYVTGFVLALDGGRSQGMF